jgi:hypothetical protein
MAFITASRSASTTLENPQTAAWRRVYLIRVDYRSIVHSQPVACMESIAIATGNLPQAASAIPNIRIEPEPPNTSTVIHGERW